MRPYIDLVESLAVNHGELDAPDVTGVIPIAEIADLFKADDPLIFTLAMRKIITNRTEQLNDFEILEIAKAFINFVGMSTEEGIRIATRMGLITTAHHGGKSDTELDDSDFEEEIAELEAEEEPVIAEPTIDTEENPLK